MKVLAINAVVTYTIIVLKTDNKPSSLSQDVKIVIASVCVFVVSSAVFLVIGLLCRYFHPKRAKSCSVHVHGTAPTPEGTDSEASSSNTVVQKVELKENIAYIPVRLQS